MDRRSEGQTTGGTPRPTARQTVCLTLPSLDFLQIFFNNNSEDGLAQAHGWLEHSSGAMALLMARSPRGHMSGNAHTIFTDFRASVVRLSRPCCLPPCCLPPCYVNRFVFPAKVAVSSSCSRPSADLSTRSYRVSGPASAASLPSPNGGASRG